MEFARSVSEVDFPTPYYKSNQGADKLTLLAETLRTKVLGLRSDQVVPVLSVQLGPGRGGKRLALLTGRVGRGERLRGVLRVCGKLEIGVAKVSSRWVDTWMPIPSLTESPPPSLLVGSPHPSAGRSGGYAQRRLHTRWSVLLFLLAVVAATRS